MLVKEAPLVDFRFADVLQDSSFYEIYPDLREDLNKQLSGNDRHFLQTGKAIFDDAAPQLEEATRSRLNLMAAAVTYTIFKNLDVQSAYVDGNKTR